MSDFDENPFADLDDNSFEEYIEETEETETTRPSTQKRSNRSFLIALGVIAAIFVIAAGILVYYAFFILPQNQAARLEENAQINAANTATSMAATQYAVSAQETSDALLLAQQEEEMEDTPTPLIIMGSQTPEPEEDGIGQEPGVDRTATISALLTRAANNGTPIVNSLTPEATSDSGQGGLTPTSGVTSTALPTTGFIDDVGIPALFGIALGLIIIIFVSRRLRASVN